jgi:hypothetical protein
MALAQSPKIATDGLVMYYDMANTAKSWPGPPNTNLSAGIGIGTYLNTPSDVTSSLTLTGEYYKGSPVYKQVLTPITATGVGYLTNASNPGIGVVTGGGGGAAARYTGHSIFFKPAAGRDSLNASTPIYTHYSNISGWQSTGNYNDMGDGWYRANVIFYSASGGSDGKYWAINPAGATLNVPITIFWAGPFKEDRNDNVVVSSYVPDSRNAAQAAQDLTGNRTTVTLNITSPLTYSYLNSTSSALITDSSSILNTDTHSIFFAIRFNTTAAYGANGYSGSWDKIFTFNCGGSDRSPGIWRWPGERSLHWRYDPGNTGCDFGKSAGTGFQFDIDTWYYVGVTKDGALAKMFVNGIQIGTGSVANPKAAGTAPVTLYENHPVGLSTMGLCQVYNRVISPAEVMQNFTAIRGRYGI